MLAEGLRAWPKRATKEARNIVLDIIKSQNTPISTRDVFKKAVSVPASPAKGEPLSPSAQRLRNLEPAPPHPDHPVRSLTYLKRTVLEDLARTGDIKKVHIKRELSPEEIEQRKATMSKAQAKKKSVANLSDPVSTWMWQLVDKSNKKSSVESTKEDEDEGVLGAEVGVEEDWSHLNKRRQRARGEKALKDLSWAELVQRAREMGNSDS
ncbi:hypothetical protein DFH94DRAFT_742660 [Russula ochroleuca]|uniref:Uncharacterized protein n=1 Tax=Russula ochroleuca TaxID=152965 RepID=A0A9P5MWF5_9AGAM|nr:hypothetical protein DFH94DRAFT_742660 [Russula ochroleuca]